MNSIINFLAQTFGNHNHFIRFVTWFTSLTLYFYLVEFSVNVLFGLSSYGTVETAWPMIILVSLLCTWETRFIWPAMILTQVSKDDTVESDEPLLPHDND